MNALIPRTLLPLEPRVLAFGGGGGGVGRSTLAAELATQLARRGRKVLLVDATMQGGTHHLFADTPPKPAALHHDIEADDFDLEAAIRHGGRDKAALLSLPFARRGAAFPPRLKAQALVNALRRQNWEDILLDLDGRPDAFNASALALSDVPILVTTTESRALSMTAEWLRQMVVYALLMQPDADTLERRLLDALDALDAHFSLSDLHNAFEHPELRTLLNHVLHRASPWLLLNQTRDASERDLAQAIALGYSAMVGVRPRILGAVGWDDSRALALRSSAPLQALHAPGDSLATLTQRLVELRETAASQPRVAAHDLRLPTELIGTPEDTDPTAIRQEWRRLWEGLRRESTFTQHILPTDAREGLLAQLEVASQTIQGWLAQMETARPASAPAAPVHDSPVARSLQHHRALKGITVRDLSLRSRIGLRYLEAIEAFEIDALPREVYLRGYLREIARTLDMDPEVLVESYLDELHRARIAKLSDEPS